jgi:adenine-specific DNA methylase
MIKYLGSKLKLLPQIKKAVATHFPEARSTLDLFSGTARVGYLLKGEGHRIHSNDYSLYSKVIADCYVVTDDTFTPRAEKIMKWLNSASLLVVGLQKPTVCNLDSFTQRTENV